MLFSEKRLMKLETSIRKWISKAAEGRLWRRPVVGFCSAESTEILPKIVGNHLTAEEILPTAKGVVSYFIPLTKSVIESNIGGEKPSKLWAYAYVKTNELIRKINSLIAKRLERHGFKCAIIEPTHNFDEVTLTSGWSHKHVAYLAGIGTFGIHTMIITEKGCCGRLGSLITTAEFDGEPIDREFCLYKNGYSCLECVKRCFIRALGSKFDRKKCYNTIMRNAEIYGFFADVCGKCACGVPCSSKRPSPQTKI